MVTDAAKLLPSNATPLEIALARAAPRSVLDVQASAPAGVKHTLPDAFASWFAAEWRLAEFANYFESVHDLIEAGLPWLRQRGTAAAVKRALSWIEFSATLEEDGARLQLDPGTTIATGRLADIKHLVGASIPAHVQLYRLYHGYDRRPIILDRSRLDDGLLDDDSGIEVDGVKLSFGTRASALIALDDQVLQPGMTPVYSASIADDNSWRLDAWVLDAEILLDSAGGLVSQVGRSLDAEVDEDVSRMREEGHAVVDVDEPLLPSCAGRTERVAYALPEERRVWHGAWSGAWREIIPSKLTQESA
jgi:hypothetical protein